MYGEGKSLVERIAAVQRSTTTVDAIHRIGAMITETNEIAGSIASAVEEQGAAAACEYGGSRRPALNERAIADDVRRHPGRAALRCEIDHVEAVGAIRSELPRDIFPNLFGINEGGRRADALDHERTVRVDRLRGSGGGATRDQQRGQDRQRTRRAARSPISSCKHLSPLRHAPRTCRAGGKVRALHVTASNGRILPGAAQVAAPAALGRGTPPRSGPYP
ncbi:MAG TPA: hypothetical protein VGD08_14210 [Stellaceae bacterium]